MPHCCIACLHGVGSGSKVEVDRGFSGQEHGDVGQGASDRSGQQQSHHAVVGRCVRNQRASSRLPTRVSPNVRVLPVKSAMHGRDHWRFAVAMKRTCSRSRRLLRYATAARSALHGLPGLLGGCRGRQWGAKRHGDRVGEATRPLPQEASALEAKTFPHMRSTCTGITGTSNCSTMRSKPRLKGRRLPVRLIAPSAKMHTTSRHTGPAVPGPAPCARPDDCPGDRDGLHEANNQLKVGLL